MPFVVQPIRNAFEAMGERPLEVAATLRASPARAFWTVAVPLARPGFLTGAVLGFAHTVGEFGIVLMIGGNIPGKTKVLSVAIYDYRRDLAVARGEHPRGRHGRLRLRRHPRHDADREARRAGGRMSGGGRRSAVAFRGTLGRFASRCRLLRAGYAASRRCSDRPAAARRRCCAASPACSAARGLLRGRRRRLAGRDAVPARARAAGRLRLPGGEPLPASLRAAQPALRRAGRAQRRPTPREIGFDEVVDLLGLAKLLDAVAAQSFRRRASARRDRPGAPFAAEAPPDGRAAVGARPANEGRDPAVPRAPARSAVAARSSTSATTWPRSSASPTISC